MKKLILVTVLVILIPFIIVSLFIQTDEIKFHYMTNQTVRVKNEKTGEVVQVPFEEYIKGVLAGEMPSSFELEALKAQAVASRSYVLVKMNQNKNNDYDVVNTVNNQVYLTDSELKEKWQDDYSNRINKIKKA